MELPFSESTLDVCQAGASGRQPGGQASGSAPHLLGLGQ